MTLYETISKRRQVRKFNAATLNQKILDEILDFTLKTDQLFGQKAVFRLSSIDEMNGGTAQIGRASWRERVCTDV